MELTVGSVAFVWGPILALVVVLLVVGIRRDQGRSAGRVDLFLKVTAVASVIVLAATAVLVGWSAYQNALAEQSACTPPSSDC